MRAMDWSKSPLGPVESWPQSLRTSVSIMLSSGFAVVVAWGPEFIFLYNDRYRPVLGATKHPMALGNRSADIFPEVWDMIGPLFRKALAGDTVALDDVLIPLDRNGYLEECFFTLSYSPIRDESGGVGGMLAIVAETSERVQGERRLRTLRDLASVAPHGETAEQACENAARSLAGNRADVPFALLYLLEDDGKSARLVSSTGLDGVGGEVATPRIGLEELRSDRWPLADAVHTGRAVVVDDLARRFGPHPRRFASGGDSYRRGPAPCAPRHGSAVRSSHRRGQPATSSRRQVSTPSSSSRPSTWQRPSPTRWRTRPNASASRLWPKSIARRRRSSATSATSFARRSR